MKILIANRGEIACRILRTCQRLNIAAVTVYSTADRDAKHVRMASESRWIGEAAPQDSYLNGSAIINAAKLSQADAIHPGYGFLAENADFARACKEHDLIFIGPSPAAMQQMGSKSAAKICVARHGIPLVPGYHGAEQGLDFMTEQALGIGFPLLIKAVMGGGGKGMRVVWKIEEFADALAACQREAAHAFGDASVLLEKYIVSPRHIEVQIFGDQYGEVVHLWERDCSIQRRHQKIIEEAPCSTISAALREQLTQTAVKAAKSVKYEGAGTVEFIVDEAENYYFLEMNTRLQVEHPVTEMITGFDLVEWQIRIAQGEHLPVKQDQINCQGHAIEVRLCAEDPHRSFFPSIGQLLHLQFPSSTALRLETGVESGDSITTHYDSMIAKLICHAQDRQQAILILLDLLSQCIVIGVQTNLAFLRQILSHQAFQLGRVNTHFIEDYSQTLPAPDLEPAQELVIAAATYCKWSQEQKIPLHPRFQSEANSPWWDQDSWRMGLPAWAHFRLSDAGQNQQLVNIQGAEGHYQVTLEATAKIVRWLPTATNQFMFSCDTTTFGLYAFAHLEQLWLVHNTQVWEFTRLPFYQSKALEMEHSLVIKAPLPGKIRKLLVQENEQVNKGQALLIVESMKMEHTISAPFATVIEKIHCKENDLVDSDDLLLRFQPDAKES